VKVALGPLGAEPGVDWPVYDSDQIEGYEITPFAAPGGQDADILIWWSPEYHPHVLAKTHFNVAVLGDWHVNIPNLASFDLICADWHGIQKLRTMNYPDSKLLWWRMFSFDPRIHVQPKESHRTIDIAFCGRPQPGRDKTLEQLQELATSRGWTTHIQTIPYKRGEEVDIYQRARVVFNQSIRGELNMRLYESMACGAVALIEQDNAEVYRTDCLAIPWAAESLEPLLARLLDADDWRQRVQAQQWAWVQRNRPVDHLRWLLAQIKEQMNGGHGPHTSLGAADTSPGDTEGKPSALYHPDGQDTPGAGHGGERVSALKRYQGEPELKNEKEETETLRPPVPVALASRAPGLTKGPVHPLLGRAPSKDGSASPELNEQRREVAALVPATAETILDLGCGKGGLGWWLKEQRPSRYIVGVDEAEAAEASNWLDLAYAHNLDGSCQDAAWWVYGMYDCIVLADVVEHLKYPDILIKTIRPLLKPNGCIVLSIPNGLLNVAVLMDLIVNADFPYYRQGIDPCYGPPSNLRAYDHIRWFTPASIERLLHDAGYKAEGGWQTTLMGETSQTMQFADYIVKLRESYMPPEEAAVYRNNAFVLQYLIHAMPDWSIPG